MTYVIAGEYQRLSVAQVSLLNQYFGNDWQIIGADTSWTLGRIVKELGQAQPNTWFVFAISMPVMLLLAMRRGHGVMCFHNDTCGALESGWLLV
jgi:hypothetical protein